MNKKTVQKEPISVGILSKDDFGNSLNRFLNFFQFKCEKRESGESKNRSE
jgi:hypothetical protein